MALVLADRVKETTNITGTGGVTFDGASTGFTGFADAVGDGNTTYYAISSPVGSEFEVGIGTYTLSTDTLSRDTVLASSNSGSLVNFSAGTKDVFVVYPADKSVYKDESGVVPATTFDSVAMTTGTVSTQPTTASGIANKAYVDGVAQGLQAKPADDVATTANLDATYDNGTDGVGATLTANANGAFPTVDGFDMSVGETILVKDQTDLLENGSYELTDAGSATTPWVLTRAPRVNETDEIPGAFEFVINGTLQAGSGFVATTPSDFLIGSSAATSDPNGFTQRGDIEWVQFSGAGTFTAGTGLDLTGTEFSLSKLGIEDLTDPGADRILFYDNSAASTEWLTVGSNLTLSGTTLSADTQSPVAGTAIDVSGTTVNLDLSELTTSTSNADGDFFVVVDDANGQHKLDKASINVSEFNNDAGYDVGSVTSVAVSAGTGLTGGGTVTSSGTISLNVDLNELGSSTSNSDGDLFAVVNSTDGSQHKLSKNSINISGFNNDAGYLTSESDTLDSVTDRGTTTTNAITVGGATVDGNLNVDSGTLFVDSANNRVGVGTSTPSAPFQINTSGSEAARINSDGQLMLGLTDTQNLSGDLVIARKLAVVGTQGGTMVLDCAGVSGSFSTIKLNFEMGDSSSAIVELQIAGFSGRELDFLAMQYSNQSPGVIRNTGNGLSASLTGSSVNNFEVTVTGGITHPVVFVKVVAGRGAPNFSVEPTLTFS